MGKMVGAGVRLNHIKWVKGGGTFFNVTKGKMNKRRFLAC